MTATTRTTRFVGATLAAVFVLAILGCEGGTMGGMPVENSDNNQGGPGDVSNTGGMSQSQDEALNKLGVNTTPTDRVDENGDALPDDFSPLGSSCKVGQTDELFIVGVAADDDDPNAASTARFAELADDDTGTTEYSVLMAAAAEPVWEKDNHSTNSGNASTSAGSQTLRAATAGDVDGDGRDEIIVAFNDPDSASRADAVQIAVINDPGDSAGDEAAVVVFRTADIRDIDAVALDFDGDGDADVAVSVSTDTDMTLLFVERTDDGKFVHDTSNVPSFAQFSAGTELSAELAAGNLDRDNGQEVAVVMNEFDPGSLTGIARLSVFDDAKAGFAALIDDDPVMVTTDRTYVAQVADVAMGDIDADGKDEIALGGIVGFFQTPCTTYGHIALALDDAAADAPLKPIGAKYFGHSYIPTGCETNSDTLRIRKVHVNTLDVDGDNVDEVQVGLYVFEDFSDAATPPFTEIHRLPNELIYRTNIDSGGTYGDTTSTMVVGDVTGDGRDDIISYTQWRNEISVWGLEGPGLETAEWKEELNIPTERHNGQARVFPLMVACDADADGLALRYSAGEYRFVYTQPVIIAAVAAAPCQVGIGQNTDACTTTYGESTSSSNGVDGSVSVSASTFVSVEAKDPFFGIGVGASDRVTATASFSSARSYTLTETVEYTTGPMEDTVIFTSIPMDQYVYTITSHPDPSLIGQEVTVNLPRSPVTLQVPREFYNQNVAEGSFIVGENVFQHTAGQLDSYPTENDADALIARGGDGLKASRAVSAPLGTGQVSTTIEFSEDTSYRAGAEVSYESEVEVSGGGVSVGLGVGGSVGSGLSWGYGNSTIYSGTVGAIPPDQNAAYGYKFGLFTYIYNYGDRTQPQFEVINYWVER